MSLVVNGFTVAQPGETSPWGGLDTANFTAFANLLPTKGNVNVDVSNSGTPHLHSKLFSETDAKIVEVTGTTMAVGGNVTVTGNIVQADGQYISTDEVRARDSGGLKLYDDGGGVAGILVEDGGDVLIRRNLWDASNDATLQLGDSNNTLKGVFNEGLRLTTSQSIAFLFGSGSSVVFNSSGDVGINESTPGSKLEVNGTFKAVGASVFSNTVSIAENLTMASGRKIITDEIKALGASGLRLTGSSDPTQQGILVDNLGKVMIGTATIVERLTLDGYFAIKEQASTPTPVADWGKLYTKSDNVLYFQDGGGTEQNISNPSFSLVDDTSPKLGANLDVNGKKIVSVSNGDIILEPNGTGKIMFFTDDELGWSGGNFVVKDNIQCIGEDGFDSSGETASYFVGDHNHKLEATYGTGLKLSTSETLELNASDILKLFANNSIQIANDGSCNVAIGGEYTNEQLTLNGFFSFKELGTTSPTPTTNFGKLWTKTDNILYFQDGDGAEHILNTDNYAEIYVYDGSTAITSIGTSYVQVTTFTTNGESKGSTPDHTNDHITVSEDGIYEVSFGCSFSGTLSTTFDIGIFKNNGDTQLTNVHISRKLGTGGDVGDSGRTGKVRLSATDTIELWVKADGAGTSFTAHDMNLSLKKIDLAVAI